MTHATASLTTHDALARGRTERAAAFATLLRWLTRPTAAARPARAVRA